MHMLAQVGDLMQAAAHSFAAGGNGRQIMAYLDPGSGSYLLQLLIAGIVGGALLLRAYWARVGGFIRGLFGGKAAADDQPSVPADPAQNAPSDDDRLK